MRFPYRVAELSPRLLQRWNTYYLNEIDRDWDVEEGLWRRTQGADNASESGWQHPNDARRRILHYRYRFCVEGGSLLLHDFYLMMSVALPKPELRQRITAVDAALIAGGWSKEGQGRWAHGDLVCEVVEAEVHPQDVHHGRTLPVGYGCHDIVIRSSHFIPDAALIALPWQVLAGGMRAKDRRGEPHVVPDLGELTQHLPFQVELGCGMSVEASVPALHRLHEIYQVTDRSTGAFVFSPGKDGFATWLVRAPEAAMTVLTEMFSRCLSAEPTAGHHALRSLADAGHMVGPVITNNFDGLAVRAGLGQCYVRRYDEAVPEVPWLPETRSLLVIGSHADRRRVQARARARGLKVFYLDPEGFWEGDRFVAYPIEGIRDNEVLCRRPASSALQELATQLGCAVAEGVDA
ncbi:hypothetical protein [Nocardia sp. NPDC060259]|uniref:hypothetical protein n=1 Tax=Nocardia sp. NPDC060259 TaxID=3347088 RepID=UPI0036614CDE